MQPPPLNEISGCEQAKKHAVIPDENLFKIGARKQEIWFNSTCGLCIFFRYSVYKLYS